MIVRFILVFLVVFSTIAVNMPSGIFRGLAIDPKYPIALVAAYVSARLLSTQKLTLIALVLFVALFANLPDANLKSMGLERLWVIIALLTLCISPIFMRTPSR